MDTTTIFNFKTEPVNKAESLGVSDSARSEKAKKSDDSFKSAYKEQLNADKTEVNLKEQQKEKALPQNGNDLPDKEMAQSESKQNIDNPSSQKSSLDQEADQSQVEQAVVASEVLLEQEGSVFENEKRLGNFEQYDEVHSTSADNQAASVIVLSEQKPSVAGLYQDKQISVDSRNKQADLKQVSNQSEWGEKHLNKQLLKTESQEKSSGKKETALGKSVLEFQQYIENSKNKLTVVQTIANVKSFENKIKSEIINAQLQLSDKNSLLNANSGVSSVLSHTGVNSSSTLNSLSGINVQNMMNLEVKPGVGKAGWSQAFNNQIMLMAGNGVQQAKIKLNPQHLGPVEVNIRLTKEVAVINLSSVHVSTRDAIDGAIPRLKEMLNENGFSQVDVNVSHQDKQARQEAAAFNRSSSQERSNNEHGNSTMPGDEQLSELSNESEEGSMLSRKLTQSLNIVDYYA